MKLRPSHAASSCVFALACASTPEAASVSAGHERGDQAGAEGETEAQTRSADASIIEDPLPSRGPLFHSSTTLPKPLPLSPQPPPSKGFEPIDASVVLVCNYGVAVAEGTLVRSRQILEDELEGIAALDEVCGGELSKIDFEAHALAAVRVPFTASIVYAATQGQALEVGVVESAYCEGPQPPGPSLAFIAVPAAVDSMTIRHRSEGACTGEPRP
ncbi:hypothetical protein PPSIR1_32567 [Plesiocystis pacifica SIR-1]|uniref:Uncharacterized protein n=1 Tax=Plesiocystis pacifica SIR-1 TaxID=391625 RepID=A6G5P9_9BACT|nr:hypothetical protein [Plesiocystis pacifica]EDM78830.1 hypothetical protein PPSIR1_32567 [Plesiocystis pacifica SIR-1]